MVRMNTEYSDNSIEKNKNCVKLHLLSPLRDLFKNKNDKGDIKFAIDGFENFLSDNPKVDAEQDNSMEPEEKRNRQFMNDLKYRYEEFKMRFNTIKNDKTLQPAVSLIFKNFNQTLRFTIPSNMTFTSFEGGRRTRRRKTKRRKTRRRR